MSGNTSTESSKIINKLIQSIDVNRELSKALQDEIKHNSILRLDLEKEIKLLSKNLNLLDGIVRGIDTSGTSLMVKIVSLEGICNILKEKIEKISDNIERRETNNEELKKHKETIDSNNKNSINNNIISIASIIIAFIIGVANILVYVF
jgi:chromosome segregation ATPase